MTQQGIISDDWLMSYAAGALSEQQALLVATHVSYHPSLQVRLAEAEAVGGALLEALEPATLGDDAFDELMARIESAPRPTQAPNVEYDNDIPAVLGRYLGRPMSELKWRTMGPGMKQCRLDDGPEGQKLWLLKAQGGVKIPVHDHGGSEFTLVLRGGYRAGEAHYTRGLVEYADSELTSHQPVIDEGEECICLVVTEAPIRLHSLIGRMVQPFIGL